MTVAEANYPFRANEMLKPFYRLMDMIGKMNSDDYGKMNSDDYGKMIASTGSLDEETGELVFRFCCDETFYQIHDMAHIEGSPTYEDTRPICYRYDHEIEIEFEVTE